MRWGKVQRKLLRLKPYLLDPIRVRSTRAAKKLLYKQGLPSAMEVMEVACIRANLSWEQWEALVGIPKKTLVKKCRRVAPVRLGNIALLSRHAAWAFGLVLLLALFLVFTPSGRAFAKSLYNAVSEIVGNVLHVRSSESDGSALKVPNIISREEETVLHFDSIEALADYVDYPVYYLADEKAEIEGISLVESRQMGERISVVYHMDGKIIVTNQTDRVYSTDGKADFIVAENSNYYDIKSASGIIVEGIFF